ncbi:MULTISPECIES: response regulator transcription factor [unclassified Lentimonas]|uniref:response regulator n=1 Tax=unclassified Lentimonas TaxID=2630993 RepID=UPI001326F8FA|nr:MULTISPECIES: response regulator transcription factor [unclassified Lentimonas]CAA6677773.1 Nitrate/nitrite response regulator protein [Lentimonas sp. CC4]CAA6685038.1 Nitrate/nitrite response regulator protein [Lentimonas sp. CC6]CAA7077845.1 Nitrate/nitrite response regulator protein [Lentimonas sp. CC4]CAA7169773.1 Nitrate/nitrite response regulator protein [Lentimonas sp. CC21]CAA7179891.1 Nitrate/nitrite response regulator protein [Lentimonas sp. CC8]
MESTEITSNIRVSLVEDHPGFREIITLYFKRIEGIELISQFGTAEAALRVLEKSSTQTCPDVILLDLNLPGISGLDAIRWIQDYSPNSKIIILTQSEKEADVVAAIRSGAVGYLLKSATAQEITDGIRNAMQGGASLDPKVAIYILNLLQGASPKETLDKPLSERELEILQLLSAGLVKKEIADQLNITITTVKYHIRHIYEKLQVVNAAAAVDKGHRTGIIDR